MAIKSIFTSTATVAVRCFSRATALSIAAAVIIVPAALSFAGDDKAYKIASANQEIAGGVVEYDWDRDDFIDAGSRIIGVFDIFGSGEEDAFEEALSNDLEKGLAIEQERASMHLMTAPDIQPEDMATSDELEQTEDIIIYEEPVSTESEDIIKTIEEPDSEDDRSLFSRIFESSDNEDETNEEQLSHPVPEEKPTNHIVHNGPLDIENPPLPKARPFLVGENGEALSSEDAGLYREIFSLQSAGKMKEANKKIQQLTDLRLRGHMLYQRYMHPTSYITTFDELRNWLVLYSDLPGAKRVYNLALRKKPAEFNGYIQRPKSVKTIVRRQEPNIYHGDTYISSRKRNSAQQRKVRDLASAIASLVRRDRFTVAYKKLSLPENAQYLDDVEFDNLRARIAEGYLHHGMMTQAYDLASQSAQRSGEYAPLAGWIAGLVAWGNGQYEEAAKYFYYPARSRYASSWTQAAGAFWAARASMRAGQSSMARAWLKEAIAHPRTFYGLIAARAMGRNISFNWDFPEFNENHKNLLLSTAEGKRAADLVQAGQIHLAEAELLQLNPQTEKMQEALLAFAGHAGLPALALRAGSAFEGPRGYYDAALFPIGNWKPRDDYKVDPDLVHAIMRQESKFDARAESRSGALGLMQIMPSTASFISGKRHMKSRTGQELLLEPDTNIELGQKYLEFLLENKHVNGDMMSMLIAYNAGPGNLRRWKKQWDGISDPLLFVELIPARETRAYVERVLANYWIYRFRAGLRTPTLDALAKGRTALYAEAQKASGRAQLYKVAQTP